MACLMSELIFYMIVGCVKHSVSLSLSLSLSLFHIILSYYSHSLLLEVNNFISYLELECITPS
jgi:amino acid transporter